MRSFAILCPSLAPWGCFSPAQIWYRANHNSVDLFLFLIIFYEFFVAEGWICPVFHEVNIFYFPSCLKSSNRKANLNSFKDGVKEYFFKKLKNEEQYILLIKVMRCMIFGNVSTSEGALTIFYFPVILELVHLATSWSMRFFYI